MFTVDHIGWVTDNIQKFESFWVNVLGYHMVHESEMSVGMAYNLFGIYSKATIRRYHKDESGPDIEIHCFREGSYPGLHYSNFDRFGMNHICILVGGPGSRQEFLKRLPDNVERHIVDNPKGWQNIFIRDFEKNWIEIRENFS